MKDYFASIYQEKISVLFHEIIIIVLKIKEFYADARTHSLRVWCIILQNAKIWN